MFQICGFCDFLNMKSKFSGLCKPHAGENAYLTGKMVWNRLFNIGPFQNRISIFVDTKWSCFHKNTFTFCHA